MSDPTPTPTPSPRTPQPDAAALQDALAAEHAAVWAYGVVGAHVSGERLDLARESLDEHVTRRDAVRALLHDLGAEPVAARPAYALPFEVTAAATAVRLAQRVEQGAAAVWADAVAGLSGARRPVAAAAVRECALRGARWGATPPPLPGLSARA